MKTKSKKLTLIATSVLTLGALSIVFLTNKANENTALLASYRGVTPSERTARAWQENRVIRVFYTEGNDSVWPSSACSFFKLSDELAYAIIDTSQQQYAVQDHDDPCAFTLWTHQDSYFKINSTYSDDKSFYLDNKLENPIDVVKFRHLTKIDIVLDNSLAGQEDNNRTTAGFTASTGNVTEDPVEDLENKCVTYTWTAPADPGYIGSDTQLTFTGKETATDKVYWVRELVFYYDC